MKKMYNTSGNPEHVVYHPPFLFSHTRTTNNGINIVWKTVDDERLIMLATDVVKLFTGEIAAKIEDGLPTPAEPFVLIKQGSALRMITLNSYNERYK